MYINLETDMMYLHGAVLFVGKLTYTKEGGYDMVTYCIYWRSCDLYMTFRIYKTSFLSAHVMIPWDVIFLLFFPMTIRLFQGLHSKNDAKWRVHKSCILMSCFNITRLDLGNRFTSWAPMIVIDGAITPVIGLTNG